MESYLENSTANAVKQLPISLCQENLTTCEDFVAGSEFLFVTEDEMALDKTLVVQKTMVLKERILVSRLQNESFDQPIPPHSSSTISSKNENLIDEMEISSQTSFMELCSQESAEKMDACSQESIISKMDLASQENVLKIEDNGLIGSESQKINEARSVNYTLCPKSDLKRKHVINESLDDIYEEDPDILLREEVVGLYDSIEGLKDRLSSDLQNHTLYCDGKNAKRIRK